MKRAQALLYWSILIALALVACDGGEQRAPRKIGIVHPLPPAYDGMINAFKATLSEEGYPEGETAVYVVIDSGTEDAIRALVEQDKVDLIVTYRSADTQVAQQVTATVPIVFIGLMDPVGQGIIDSAAAPGRNATGVMLVVADDRRFELFAAMVPTMKRVYFPYDPDNPAAARQFRRVGRVAAALGIEIVPAETRSLDEARHAIEAIPGDVDGVFTSSADWHSALQAEWTAATLSLALPYSAASISVTEAHNPLMGYSPTLEGMGEQAAEIAVRALNGGQPEALPVETAEFSLAIDLRTADLLGLDIPDDILRQARFVIHAGQ
jgi:putative ABC transport system substrate-binding protein